MKNKNKSKDIFGEIIIWLIRFFGIFLTICWFFVYRTPINILDGNIFYRMGAFAELLVILLVLYKVVTFGMGKLK